MENKKPVNIFNGLKFPDTAPIQRKINGNLITIQFYQNSKNIIKPFVKPISRII